MNTRQDYIRAAELVKTCHPSVKVVVANAFGVFFRDDNPRFDLVRFLDACQIYE